jgi:chlorophyll(ide) b reductase
MKIFETVADFVKENKYIVGGVLSALLGYALFPRKKSLNSLKGKSNLGIVVTGGSKGIGFHLVDEFLKAGHRVVFCSRSQENIDEALKKLNNHKNLFASACDITQPKEVEKFAKFSAEILGNIDIWINNAGIPADFGLFDQLDCSSFKNTIETNVIGSMYCSKFAIQQMKKQTNGGHLFQMEGFGSHGGLRTGLTTYGTSKFGIVYLAKALANECMGTNVGSHRLYPGLTLTDFITKGDTKVTKEMAFMLNAIGDTPDNVAKSLVPQILNVEGTSKHFEYVKQWQYAFKFMTSRFRKNPFYDDGGNLLKNKI